MKKFLYPIIVFSSISSFFVYSMEEKQQPVEATLQAFNTQQTLQAIQEFKMLQTTHSIARRDFSEEIDAALSPERKRIQHLEQHIQDLREALSQTNEETEREREDFKNRLKHQLTELFLMINQALSQKPEQLNQKYEESTTKLLQELQKLVDNHNKLFGEFQQFTSELGKKAIQITQDIKDETDTTNTVINITLKIASFALMALLAL